MDRLGAAIRRYLADLGDEQPLDDEDEGARGQEILFGGDQPRARRRYRREQSLESRRGGARHGGGFAPQELDLIAAMHAELVESLRLGLTVFLRGDAALREARQLVARKRLLRRLEAEAADLNIRSPAERRQGRGRGPRHRSRQRHPSCAWCGTCGAYIPISPLSPTRSSSAPAGGADRGDRAALVPQPDSSPTPDRPRIPTINLSGAPLGKRTLSR